MKPKIVTGLLILGLIGLTVAQLPTLNTTITVTKEQKNALTSIGLDSINNGATICETPRNICTTTLHKGNYNDKIWFKYDPNDSTTELQAKRDQKIKEKLELTANKEIQKQKETKEEKLGPGTITIGETK